MHTFRLIRIYSIYIYYVTIRMYILYIVNIFKCIGYILLIYKEKLPLFLNRLNKPFYF